MNEYEEEVVVDDFEPDPEVDRDWDNTQHGSMADYADETTAEEPGEEPEENEADNVAD